MSLGHKNDTFRVVPGSPLAKGFFSFSSRGLSVPTPFWFSYARYSLIYYLKFISTCRSRKTKHILLPDYMCHEVVNALKQFDFEISYYPLSKGFGVDLADLARRLEESNSSPDTVVVCHFYGKFIRNLKNIGELCREKKVVLIEDCAHFPYPYYPENSPFISDARVYSFRKVYPVPYGSTVFLKQNQEEFTFYILEQVKITRHEKKMELVTWYLREMVKRMIISSGVSWRREYSDLANDALKPYNVSHPWVEKLLGVDPSTLCLKKRRENYEVYLRVVQNSSFVTSFLKMDNVTDAPYQFLLCLPEGRDPMEMIKFFLHYGVSAVKGLALHHDVLSNIDSRHTYNRFVALPLHQDISRNQIEYVATLLEKFKNQPVSH